MNNFLLFLGGVLVLLLGAAFAVPQYVDWNEWRSTFEDEASRVMGRRIRVGGNVDVRFLPSPYIRFERLRVADENGRFGAPFFKADGFRLWLSVVPLMRGTIEAKQIELIRPRLRLVFDKDGRGNWRRASSEALASQGPPARIALQSVTMKDGRIVVVHSDGSELVRLTAINGELSARSIMGPYRFDGRLLSGGRQRKIRFTSGSMDNDGAMSFKSVLTAGSEDPSRAGGRAGAQRYALNGKLSDFFGSPKLEADLSAALPFLRDRKSKPTFGLKGVQTTKPAVFDLRSKLKVDAAGVKLSGMSLSFEQAGRPQLLSGEITATWDKEFATRAAFSSRWLDLDRIAGGGEREGPVVAMARIIGQLNGLFGNTNSSRASLSIDQANLGGDVVSDIFLDVSQAQGQLKLEALRASLPGRASIFAKGRLSGGGESKTFDGDVVLHGGNLQQFADWALPVKGRISDIGSGSFSLSSEVASGPGWVSLREMNAELDNTVLAGALQYRWRGKGAVTLDLEAPYFDASRLLPQGLRIADLLRQLRRPWQSVSSPASGGPGNAGPASAANGAKSTSAGTSGAGADAAKAFDKQVKLRIGRLTIGKDRYQDVELDLSLKDGLLLAPVLRLSAGQDLTIDLSARIAGLGELSRSDRGAGAQSVPLGVVKGTVRALTGDAIDRVSRIFSLPEELRPNRARRAALAPLRLAGRMTFAAADTSVADTSAADTSAAGTSATASGGNASVGAATLGRVKIALSGSSAGGRTELAVDLDGGLQHWRDALADVMLTIRNQNSTALLNQLLHDGGGSYSRSQTTAAAKEAVPGVFRMRAIGIPAQSLTTVASLQADGVAAKFDGRLQVTNDANSEGPAFQRLTGRIKLDARNAAPVLSALGLDAGLSGPGNRVSGTMELDAGQDEVALSDLQLVVMGAAVTGEARLTRTGEGRHKLVAQLSASKISAMALIAPALRHGRASPDSEAEQNIWPASVFNFDALERLDGEIKLKTASLTLGPDVALSDATLDILLGKGKLVVRSLSGNALGGRLTGALQLEEALAGAKLKAVLKIERAQLAQLLSTGVTGAGETLPPAAQSLPPAAEGHGSMTLSFSGQALSPRGIMSAATGSGFIAIGPARLHRMSASAVNASADAVLDQKPDDPDSAIRAELMQRLAAGDYQLGPRKIELTLEGGALRADTFSIDAADGTVTTTNVIDLASLMLDSEWRVKPNAQVSQVTGKTLTALPAVTVTYVGSLGRLGALKAQIDAAALVRELTVREMERDVERLEQLRKRDEERARLEAERRRAVELERARQQALIEAERLRQLRARGQSPQNGTGTGAQGWQPDQNGVPGQSFTPGQTSAQGAAQQPGSGGTGPSPSSLQSSGLAPTKPGNGRPAKGAAKAGGADNRPAPPKLPKRKRVAKPVEPPVESWNPFVGKF